MRKILARRPRNEQGGACLDDVIARFIYQIEAYWPGNGYFHRRNRQKAARAWTKHADLAERPRREVVAAFKDALRARAQASVSTWYVVSNGSSGCHFLGSLLDGIEGFALTDEIYFPPQLMAEIEGSADPEMGMAIDFVNMFHLGFLGDEVTRTTVVNIGHLRQDVTPTDLRRNDRNGRFLLLLRNPYDVAISRAFRKEAYRKAVAPGMSDDEYLERQINATAGYLGRSADHRWDRVVRYEHLRAGPDQVVGDLLREAGRHIDRAKLADVKRRHDAERISRDGEAPGGSNLNLDPRPELKRRHARMLLAGLEDLAGAVGYDPTTEVIRALEAPSGVAEQEHSTTRGAQGPGARLPVSPARRKLWLPQYTVKDQYREERYEALTEGRLKVFRSMPEVRLAAPFEWTEDPIGSATWRLYFHGLTWLLAAVWGADRGPDRLGARRYLVDVVDDYLGKNVFDDPDDKMAADDHAVADRLTMLCLLWDGDYLGEDRDAPGMDRYLQAIALHVATLESFYESAKWFDSNHGLFHALALIDAAVVLDGESELGERARGVGEPYLEKVLGRIVDAAEGVSLEQSVHYHQFVLRMLRSMRPFVERNVPEIGGLVRELAGRMVAFNLCIRGVDDAMPAIGDSRVGDRIPGDCTRTVEGEVASDAESFERSKGSAGRPFSPMMVFRRSGYGVFREGESYEGDLARGLFLFQPDRVPHGHFDALNVTLHLDGDDVLIDSGGPYAYGDPLRFTYFAASRAHNVVRVDGRDHQGAAELLDEGQTEDCYWLTAGHSGYAPRSVVRSVTWVPGCGMVVLDTVSEAEEADHEMLWHLPPGARMSVEANGQGAAGWLEGGRPTWFESRATVPLEVFVREGELEPEPHGWVTEKLGHKRPAPVLVVGGRSTAMACVTVLARPGVPVESGTDGGGPWVVVGGRRVRVGDSGRPLIDQR